MSKNILGKVPLTKSIKGLDWKKKLKLCFSWISDNPLSKNQNKPFIELLLKCVGCFRLYNEIKKGFLPKSSYNVINRPTFITKPFLLPKISRKFFLKSCLASWWRHELLDLSPEIFSRNGWQGKKKGIEEYKN